MVAKLKLADILILCDIYKVWDTYQIYQFRYLLGMQINIAIRKLTKLVSYPMVWISFFSVHNKLSST